MNQLTDGGYFYHLITLHDLPWFGDRFFGFLQGFASAYGAFAITGILARAEATPQKILALALEHAG